MRRRLPLVLVALALVAAACSFTKKAPPIAAKGNWVEAWQAVPMGVMPNGCGARGAEAAFPGNRAVSQSVRFTVRPTAAGPAIRIRLSNRFSPRLLTIKHVAVALHTTGANTAAGTSKDVLFSGVRSVTISAGSEAISDPVAMNVDPDRPITISIAIGAGGPLTWHAVGTDLAYATAAGSGDRAADASGSAFRTQMHSYVALASLQVSTTAPTTAIVALGDSITDNPQDALNRHWLDILGSRLRAAGKPRTVVNAGISCNALVSADSTTGLAAAGRFSADVLNRQAVSHVILFEGTNDIHGGQPASAVIAALSALAARAHAAGIKAIGATILPTTDGPIPGKDAQRALVNEWIRTTTALDGVIDFDAVIRSAANPQQMNASFASDSVHPNTRGHIAMGNAIDLSLFDR